MYEHLTDLQSTLTMCEQSTLTMCEHLTDLQLVNQDEN